MNKTLRNLALVALAAAPFSAYAENSIAGSGTVDDPFVIATADDLCHAWEVAKAGVENFFIQVADIDMSGVEEYTPVTGYDSSTYNIINYDGKNHVISNFAPTKDEFVAPYCYGQSIFGLLQGELKNLGIVNVKLTATQGRAGAVSGYCGYGGVELTKLSNVYVTGKVDAGSSNYTGGLFGTTGGAVELNNCFVNVEMTGAEGGKNGALAGRLNAATTINNCYVAGTVSGNANLVCYENKGAVAMNGFVLFNTGSETTGLTNTANTGTFNQYTSNNASEGIATVKSWPAFSETKEIDGYPALNYALSGAGTDENPYIIASVEDLCAMWLYTSTHNSDEFYFVQTADIDMADVEVWHAPLGSNGDYDNLATIHYDGQNHVIRHFAPANNDPGTVAEKETNDYYAGSLFGVFTGTIENLGVEDVFVEASKTLGLGVLGAYGSYCGASTVNNVYVTGKVNADANYGAGMFGTMAANKDYSVTISNCYVDAEIEGAGYIGAFMGRVDGPVFIDQSYAAGSVEAGDKAGLILGADRGKATAQAYLDDVVAFNSGAAKAVACPVLEGSDFTVANADNKAALIAAISEDWDGFDEGKLNANGLPALNWQDVETAGFVDVVVDGVEANGPAVYYNLQGVRVANPENGIYIVRRGNKVTKELVK